MGTRAVGRNHGREGIGGKGAGFAAYSGNTAKAHPRPIAGYLAVCHEVQPRDPPGSPGLCSKLCSVRRACLRQLRWAMLSSHGLLRGPERPARKPGSVAPMQHSGIGRRPRQRSAVQGNWLVPAEGGRLARDRQAVAQVPQTTYAAIARGITWCGGWDLCRSNHKLN